MTPSILTSPEPQAQTRDPESVLSASTFSAGLLLLPPGLRDDASRLYCLLRTIDDLVDERHPDAEQRITAIECWAHSHPAKTQTAETQTLTQLSQSYPLSKAAVLEFCAGMRHDLTAATIQTESDLERYCEQVAGTVGVMLTALLGSSDPDGPEKMATLGRAMQRTNVLRDIDEDLANHRLYIPQTAIQQYGFPYPGQREQLLRTQIARADALYEAGSDVIATLIHGRHAMGLSIALYREILRQIEREGYGREAGRATVPAWRKQQVIRQTLRGYIQKHARQRS